MLRIPKPSAIWTNIGVFRYTVRGGLASGHVQRQPKDVRVGLANVDEAGRNKRIHKPGELELANPIRIHRARFIADYGDLQSVPDLELGDQIDHLGVRFDCANMKRRNCDRVNGRF